MGWGTHHCPDKTTGAFTGAFPTFCLTDSFFVFLFFVFYIISLRNKTVLGLSEACGYNLGFRAQPTLSAALGSVGAWLCFFSLWGKDPYPSSVSLFGQACLEATSCHMATSPFRLFPCAAGNY